MSAGAALGESLSGKLGIEHVLTALPVLDAHLAQTAVQLLGTHSQFLGQLRGGDAVDGVQHRVGILGSWLQLGNLLVTFRQGRLHNLHRTLHHVLIALPLLRYQVTALLTDGWKYFRCYPSFESLGTL